ncbi:MAG: FtsX-like permease family protein [Acidobacteria bacterium]|nr:FtsX-like permease family protein [Acidobacteriota bacterium]
MSRLAMLNDGDWLTVVGVAGSVHTNAFGIDVDRPDPFEIYLPWASRSGMWRQPRFVLVRTAAGSDPIGLLKQQVWRLDPQLPVTVHALDDVVAATLAQPRFITMLLAAFALLAVLLAGAGLYAVVAYETSARTREIGVRVALGATRGAVIRHVLGRSVLQSFAGTVLGLLGAVALTRLLAPPLYGIAPTDPMTFATAAVLLLSAAVAGAWLPARRAAATEPMTALRTE